MKRIHKLKLLDIVEQHTCREPAESLYAIVVNIKERKREGDITAVYHMHFNRNQILTANIDDFTYVPLKSLPKEFIPDYKLTLVRVLTENL